MDAYGQSDLLNGLAKIFPEFSAYWVEDNEGSDSGSSSIHAVYMSFVPFLSTIEPTQKQWQLLADHLSDAVASGGDRENAVDTCVL